jgi:hypothetical protein
MAWQTNRRTNQPGWSQTDYDEPQPDPAPASPTPTTTTPPSGGVDPTTSQAQSAKALLESTLATYGLSALAGRVWQMYLDGIPIEQIMLDLRQTPEYKARFPAMDALSGKGRAISEAEYINLEQQYVSLFRQAGLPPGFYDSPQDFASFIGNEVSPVEMGERLDVGRRLLFESPPQVRDELARLYGINEGAALAFIIDPVKALPVIQRQFIAAQAGYAAKESGYGLLTRAEAEMLGYQNRTFDELTQGFGQLAEGMELYQPIIGETNVDTFSRKEQFDAVFNSNNSVRRRLERRARERAAVFEGETGYAATRDGVLGLGSAAR